MTYGVQKYALLDAAGLTPDGVTEAPDTSQILEAIRLISGAPGNGVIWWATSDPATLGERVLLLTGQVILIASYPEMAAAVYCGDGNNPTASAFYKTSDAGGTTRSTSGTYMVMPDLRGYFLRGLDTAASVDPDGASRDIGSIQLDAFQGHRHNPLAPAVNLAGYNVGGTGVSSGVNFGLDAPGSTGDPVTDGTNGVPRTDSESRPVNIACKFGIRY